MEPTPLRILHISDLHFQSSGRELRADAKTLRTSPVPRALADDEGRRFLAAFENKLLNAWPQTHWPKAVVVSGDLVNRGGAEGEEFARATEFIKKLTKVLQIRDDAAFVVPGNHDVNWTDGLTIQEKFNDFAQATSDFVCPKTNGGDFRATWHTKPLSDSVKTEFLLFASPTFSGIPDPDLETLLRRLRRVLRDSDAQDNERIKRLLEEARGTLDIGAIGTVQRNDIRIVENDESKVRIAVLHHHLLPHPQVDITPFESVIDAGQVLSDLLDHGFDLVLTGHKHNRQVVQYRKDGKAIDVCTAPSLFEGRNPGFTIVEVLGAEQPCYARLLHYSTDCQLVDEQDLLRSGRVPAKVMRLCAGMSAPDQEKRLSPVLASLGGAFEWLREPNAPVELFEKVWSEQIMPDLHSLHERRLVFRPPLLADRWRELLSLADRHGGDLKLVSSDDLDLWKAANEPGSFATQYSDPIRRFARQRKHRVLIIAEADLRERSRAYDWTDVIESMIADDLEVSVVLRSQIQNYVASLDFALIGGFAVSKFLGAGQQVRALEESFNPKDIQVADKDWRRLVDERCWSSKGAQTFAGWLNKTYGVPVRTGQDAPVSIQSLRNNK